MNTEYTFVFHQDPGHGWLQVPLTLLHRLNVAGDISPYSYMDEQCGYLEEDADLSVFLRAAKAAGLHYQIIDRHCDDESPIRAMRSFTVAAKAERTLYPTNVGDVYCDALITSAEHRLLFASLWGRDTAIQELLARLTLSTSAGGFDCLQVMADSLWKAFPGKEPLTKTSGRLPKGNLFGEMSHVMLYAPDFASASTGSERFCRLLFQDWDHHTPGHTWQAVQHCSHLPLLSHWQQPVLQLLEDNRWLTTLPGFGVHAVEIDLTHEDYETAISTLIREQILTLNTRPVLGQSAASQAA